jgi:hypothetical protein
MQFLCVTGFSFSSVPAYVTRPAVVGVRTKFLSRSERPTPTTHPQACPAPRAVVGVRTKFLSRSKRPTPTTRVRERPTCRKSATPSLAIGRLFEVEICT